GGDEVAPGGAGRGRRAVAGKEVGAHADAERGEGERHGGGALGDREHHDRRDLGDPRDLADRVELLPGDQGPARHAGTDVPPGAADGDLTGPEVASALDQAAGPLREPSEEDQRPDADGDAAGGEHASQRVPAQLADRVAKHGCLLVDEGSLGFNPPCPPAVPWENRAGAVDQRRRLRYTPRESAPGGDAVGDEAQERVPGSELTTGSNLPARVRSAFLTRGRPRTPEPRVRFGWSLLPGLACLGPAQRSAARPILAA